MELISRKEAKAQGLKRYYTGPCPHGHDCEKLVVNWTCIECSHQKYKRKLKSRRKIVCEIAELADDRLVSKKEAKAKGLKRYFTGRPCIQGHVCERTLNGSCIQCVRAKNYRDRKIPHTGAWERRKKRLKSKAPTRRKGENRKVASALRNRALRAFKNNYRTGSAVQDLGCSIFEFRVYISNLFRPGMSWENYGQWVFDHVKPLASFDLSNREQVLEAFHFTNYQPLWASENAIKGVRLDWKIAA